MNLVVMFTSEGKIEREIDRQIGAALAVMQMLKWSVVVKREPKGKSFNLQVNLCPNSHLWS